IVSPVSLVIVRHVAVGWPSHASAGSGQVMYPAIRPRSSVKLIVVSPGGAWPPPSPELYPTPTYCGISVGPAIHTGPSRNTTMRWPGCSAAITSGDAGRVTDPDPGSLNRLVQSSEVQPSIGSPTGARFWSVISRVIIRLSRIER